MNRYSALYGFTAVVLSLCILLIKCTGDSQPLVSGSGNNTGNAAVMGTLLKSDSIPAAGVRLALLRADYDPVTDTVTAVDTTDSLGRYSFGSVLSGEFTVSAASESLDFRWVRQNVRVAAADTTRLNHGILLPSRRVDFPLPNGTPEGYAFIPGLDAIGMLNTTRDSIAFENMPQGTFASVLFRVKNDSQSREVIARDITVSPDTTVYTPSENFFAFSRRINLNTTPGGADVSQTVYSFPVMIRLHSENFDFTQTRRDGGDILFTKDDGTPLSFEVDQWIEDFSLGVVWVLIDTLHGNAEQSIQMHWGNPDISSRSNSAAVFDTTNGFESVWHLEEFSVGSDGAANFMDATGNANHGRDYVSAGGQLGLIGYGQDFDGGSDYIEAADLTVPVGISAQAFTLSCWYNIDWFGQPDLRAQHLLEFIDTASGQSYRRISAANETTNSRIRTPVSFSLKTGSGEEIITGTPDSAAFLEHWRYVVVTVDGNEVTLYQNGMISQRTTITNAPLAPPIQTIVRIGQNDAGMSETTASMDEVRISSVARNEAWIKLCFENQRPGNENGLVKFQ